MENYQDLIYDIEIYKNYFLVCSYNVDTKEKKSFEISPYKDDRKALVKYFKENKRLIGFNSYYYDNKMLVKLFHNMHLKGKELVPLLKQHSHNLIKSEDYRRFAPGIHSQPNIDLLKIHHFDNPHKMTSLKDLEFNLRLENIQELPFAHDSVLSKEQMRIVRDYCWNDIEATYQFYLASLDKIKFRERMSNVYNTNFLNANDVKIGEQILLDTLHKSMKLDKKIIKRMRTYRESMKMSDIILDQVSFESEEFNALLSWWRKQTIYDTRGQFTGLDLDKVEEILPYCDQTLKKGKLKNLNIVYKGFQFDFGTGGIHGCQRSGVWKEDEEYELILVDVSSYYPMLAKNAGFHPEHIPKEVFLKLIDDLYEQRMQGRKIGDLEIVVAIKLSLNGALYGKSNSEYSFMYDPMFMMKICVNGQLLLVSLAEQLMDAGMELIQINTDGILVKVKRTNRNTLDELCNQWMNLTGLKLDYDHFSLVVQRDVNNYMGVYTNGEVKRKGGAFAWDVNNELEWYKDHSALIVKKAVQEYFTNNVNITQYLFQQLQTKEGIYDFFLKAKLTKKTYRLEARKEGEVIDLQRITRYLVTNNGYEFVKIMPPLAGKEEERESRIEAGWKCTPYNNLFEVDINEIKENINFEYYLNEINKIIKAIENE